MVKFLMIDDNPLEHLITQKMFDKFHLFPGASHSQDANSTIDFFEENRLQPDLLPDVIFLDLYMPGFTGWDFLNRFEVLCKSIKKPIDIYIVTSSIDPDDKLRSKQYPSVKGWMCKPLKMESLLNLYSLYQHINRLAC